MKVNKLFTIDQELLEDLKKEPNQSKIINSLLKDYFNHTGHLREVEIKAKITQKKLLVSNLGEEIEELEKALKVLLTEKLRIAKVYKHIPREIMEDFNIFDKMTIESLEQRFYSVYSKKFPDLKLKELKNAFIEFRGLKNGL